MTVSTTQSAFSAGEISPELYGQVSLAKYGSALTTARNVQINYRGGAMSRGGLAFVGVCLQSTYLRLGTSTGPPRLIPFQFSITQGYELEFGDNYLRFIYQGGYVLEDSVAIVGASQADPCAIGVTDTPFANGDWVFIVGVAGMTELNGNTYVVEGAAPGGFTLTDLNGSPVDSTAFTAYAGGGTASRLYTVTTLYRAADLPYLKFSQSADVMSLTCVNPVVLSEYTPHDLTRFSAIDWTLTETDFTQAIPPPGTVNAISSFPAPASGVNATFDYQVTSVGTDGSESVASGSASCNGADIQTEAGANSIYWSYVGGAKYYNIYRAPPSPNNGGGAIAVPQGSLFGFVGSVFGTYFVDTNVVADLTQTPPVHRNPFARGQILAVDIVSGGSGLTAVTWGVTTVNGVNFQGQPVIEGQSLSAFPITDPGENYAPGDSISFNGAGFASGAILFGSANPSAADTITLNSVVWTFVAGTPSAANQTTIQGSLASTLARLASDVAASANPLLTVASYAVDITRQNLLITYGVAGTGGDSYSLAASRAAPSGPTLMGGDGIPDPSVPEATLVIGPEFGTYPGVNAYFQQRHFFANSLNNPDTFWASQTGRYADMDVSLPTRATDAITASPWTEQVNGIQWLIPMPGGLIAMTGLRAWQIIGEGSYQLNVQPITPSTTQAQPQAFNGCSATIPPIVIDYDVVYVEAISNSTVRDLSYNFFTSIYTGADLTILSSHLFLYRQLVQWAWARLPYKVLWASCNDGTMLSMTYLKEQEVYGWARHDTLGLIVSLSSITEPPVNAVYAIVQRFPPYAPQGVYVAERMDNRIWQSVEDSYAVDSGVSNPMAAPNASLYASAATGNGVVFKAGADVFSPSAVGQVIRMGGGVATVTAYTDPKRVTGDWNLGAAAGAIGLPLSAPGDWTIAQPVTALNAPHLAGMTLVGLADGVPISGLVVGGTGTVTLPFAASNVKVGLSFLAQVQTPYLNGNGVTQGARKVIPAATVRLAASGAFGYGTNEPDGAAQNPPQLGPAWTNLALGDPLKPTGGQAPATTYTSPGGQKVTQLWTGDLRVVGGGAEWNSKGQVAVQQSLPLALEVTAIEPEILDGDVPERAYSPNQQGQSQQRPAGPGRHMIGDWRL